MAFEDTTRNEVGLETRVESALRADTLDGFAEALRLDGYGYAIVGRTPVLRPLSGGPDIEFAALRLRPLFWVRCVQWVEGLDILGQRGSALPNYWQLLTGCRLDPEQCRSVTWFCTKLEREQVAEAMGIAATRLQDDPIEERFKYFCGVCHRTIKQRHPQRSRPSYRPSAHVYDRW